MRFGLSFFLRRINKCFITQFRKFKYGDFIGLCFGFLYADYIGINSFHPVNEAFSHRGPDAVHIVGDDFFHIRNDFL